MENIDSILEENLRMAEEFIRFINSKNYKSRRLKNFINEIKTKIQNSQIKAAISVNSEMLNYTGIVRR